MKANFEDTFLQVFKNNLRRIEEVIEKLALAEELKRN